ncbi:MAG TPA: ABC transporter ATP-binding protein [Hydrogenophaga sp.]|uniref:ABC transporter ATP-binding protein n=1 Tax=Hydrogenophaga sp. TaxID=1904254 RepID=UPI002C6E3699|nr:ABC transporter ATP-binding protein [Hydrogenophaga sp.]HMN93159.1 ABC transporter ATP-binding protein [Hydrogenophaga sp.]HMP10154.1 ABC transporter ATP-binding protein [Hydrogenophaga sp.]
MPETPAVILRIRDLSKTYAGGFQALKRVNLDIHRGEIFALLGPNGAGKTTLISIVCGMALASTGQVQAGGFDTVRDYRQARSLIGLVPQELHADAFETVWDTVSFSRGLFGKAPDPAYIEKILRDLSLWDKKDNRMLQLSGGMKRRVLIAKALSHEPTILFLDEPSAGVDVELRHDMWRLVRQLRDAGTTIILTTHYIEEAEDMADRIGVIRQGELIVVEDKDTLMRQLGRKELSLSLQHALSSVPDALGRWPLQLSADGLTLTYTFDAQKEDTGIAELLAALGAEGIHFRDLKSRESSLEDIFVSLINSNDHTTDEVAA